MSPITYQEFPLKLKLVIHTARMGKLIYKTSLGKSSKFIRSFNGAFIPDRPLGTYEQNELIQKIKALQIPLSPDKNPKLEVLVEDGSSFEISIATKTFKASFNYDSGADKTAYHQLNALVNYICELCKYREL